MLRSRSINKIGRTIKCTFNAILRSRQGEFPLPSCSNSMPSTPKTEAVHNNVLLRWFFLYVCVVSLDSHQHQLLHYFIQSSKVFIYSTTTTTNMCCRKTLNNSKSTQLLPRSTRNSPFIRNFSWRMPANNCSPSVCVW